MARERYIPSDNQWLNYPQADWGTFVEAVNSEVGSTVPMSIQPSGEVIIDFDNLPDGVSENDAKQAVRDNHPHR